MTDEIRKQLKTLPPSPGVYKFYDKRDSIIYIGKAKNLKNRVTTYFTGIDSHTGKLRALVSRIVRIEFTLVSTEYEALLLENSLIKKYQPKYNARLKDGKTFPFIVVKKEPFPRVFSTRTITRDGSEYFGPYVSYLQRDILLELVQKHFFIRTCSYSLSAENIRRKKFRVCLNYHIGLCKGPCEGLQAADDYNHNIEAIRNILRGRISTVIDYVKEKMKEASEKMAFERAHELKSTLEALKHYSSRSTVVNPRLRELDVFSIYSNQQTAIVNYLKVIDGSVSQADTIEYSKQLDEPDQNILALSIVELRERYSSRAKQVIVPIAVHISNVEFKSVVPASGDKKKLLEMSHKNAVYYFNELQTQKISFLEKKAREPEMLKKAQQDLDLNRVPLVMECFDNSNIQGAYPVASMAVFRNGRPHKQSYRHFNIRTVSGPDDFATMEEVIYRRYSRVLKENQALPDLVVIDGGKGQLGAAMKSLGKLGIQDQVEIISIAKRLEEIFKPGVTEPLIIDKRSTTLRLIQQIRNEAHRFGITHHRKRREKGTVGSSLIEIPGLGPASINKLLAHFKSVKKLMAATEEEVAAVVGKQKAGLVATYKAENE
jgi:excinuclease ABC subunit C